MKILSVSSGTSVHTWKWARYFVEKGHEFHITAPLFTVRPDLVDERVHEHLLPNTLPIHSISRVTNSAYWIPYVRKLVKKVRPDILEAHYIGVPASVASLSGFRPFVADAWGSDVLVLTRKPWYRVMVKSVLKRADVVFYNSRTLKEKLEELGTDVRKMVRINQGVDTGFFCPDSRSRRNIVISTRNLYDVYDIGTTVRAVPLVLEHFPRVRFLIAGDGDKRKGLEELVTKLGVEKSVVFTGVASQNEIRDWLKASKVYVSTSKSDSASVCLHEAMACGVACVVSDLAGNREWVEDGVSGLLTEVGNCYDVAEKIKELLRDRERREEFGRIGRMKVVREADYMKNMEKVEECYKGLIGGEE